MAHILEGIDPTAKEVAEKELKKILSGDSICMLIDIKGKIFAGVDKVNSISTVLSEPIEYYEDIIIDVLKEKSESLSVRDCIKIMKHSKSKKIRKRLSIWGLSKCF